MPRQCGPPAGILFGLVLVLVILLPVSAQDRAAPITIDPQVLQVTQDAGSADFFVIMRSQIDALSPLPGALSLRLPSGTARRTAAFGMLYRNAEATQAGIRAQLDSIGATYHPFWIANLIAVRGDQSVITMLATRSDVLAIESDQPFVAQIETPEPVRMPSAPIEWNLAQVQAPALWNMGIAGQGITYANADTGVQWDHPGLKPQYRGWNGSAVVHDYSWWDAVHEDLPPYGANICNPSGYAALPQSGSTTPCDDFGHGTHTLGIAVGDDGAGNRVGVAPSAKWIACRNMENGVGRPSTYIECMQFFLAPTDLNGNNPDPSKSPDVVGNSYGCPPQELCAPTSLQLTMQSLRAAGIFMAVAGGNAGPDCGTINDPPALDDSAVTVAGTDPSDNIAVWSSRGPVSVNGSFRTKPDLAAPGVGIRSTYPGNTYATLNGTSMAAPHVGGAVALLWSGLPWLRGDVDRTETLLQAGARHLTSTQGCGGDSIYQIPNNTYGYGRIDVLSAYYQSSILNSQWNYWLPFAGRWQ